MIDASDLAAVLGPHFAAVALIAARLLPVAFLCPLLGGAMAPMHVKLGLVLGLSLSIHVAGGVVVPELGSPVALAAVAGQELLFGTTLGLVAALPFDAARMGGRFIDLFRGSSAEAALPLSGTKEAASGDALYHLLLALGATGLALPLVLSALWRSFAAVPLGGFAHTEEVVMHVVALVGQAFATGLAIGAPVAGTALAVDAALGLASRVAPQMNLQDVGAPLRILAGGAVFWLTLGLIAGRLAEVSAGTEGAIAGLLEAAL